MSNISKMSVNELFVEAQETKLLEQNNNIVNIGVNDALKSIKKVVNDSNDSEAMQAFITLKMYVETMRLTMEMILDKTKKSISEREDEIIQKGE